MMEDILQIKELSASYEEQQILEDVCLKVPEGKIFCIVGESGSGKSTLIKAITGYPGLIVESGTVILDGEDITKLPLSARRKLLGRSIGVIPQNPAGSFNPIKNYAPQIRETFISHGIEFKRLEIADSFTRMGLKNAEEILNKKPYELSGGMNQRVAIASAMLLRPKILLCDEPTSALDVNTQDLVIGEFVKINRSLGTTIVMVTHNLGLARRIADGIGIMYKGRIIEQGDCEEIMTSPNEEYTGRLIAAVPRI
ncbi:MAG: ABC transporter ATP-binding protein [Butyrivibrio sp.]|nr:ABC transporter ATP-binding protein [Butyrivibrio sp.]